MIMARRETKEEWRCTRTQWRMEPANYSRCNLQGAFNGRVFVSYQDVTRRRDGEEHIGQRAPVAQVRDFEGTLSDDRF